MEWLVLAVVLLLVATVFRLTWNVRKWSRLDREIAEVETDLVLRLKEADDEFDSAARRYAEDSQDALVQSLPIEALKSFDSGRIPWAHFIEAGVLTIGDLLVRIADGVDRLPGIGPKSRAAIERSVDNLTDGLRRYPLLAPRVGDGVLADDLLRASATRFELQRVANEKRNALTVLRLDIERSKGAPDRDSLVAEFRRRLDELRTRSNPDWESVLREFTDEVIEQISEDSPFHFVVESFGSLPVDEVHRINTIQLKLNHLGVSLRKYQSFGARFCLAKKRVLLGDEMGLGKTVQALAVMSHLKQSGRTHFVVLSPAAVMFNWVHEIESKTDLEARLFYGSVRSDELIDWERHGGILVSSYASARNYDLHNQLNSSVDLFVGDESHFIKNPAARRTRVARSVAGKSEYVIFMTGTPIENQVDDFIGLVEPLNEGVARTLRGKASNVSRSVGAIAVGSALNLELPNKDWAAVLAAEVESTSGTHVSGGQKFRQLAQDVYLRRNQKDVLLELPPVLECEEWVQLTDEESAEFSRLKRERNFMRMRQAGLQSKLNALGNLIETYRASAAKMVVFTYFRETLDALERWFPISGRIDGSVPARHRQE